MERNIHVISADELDSERVERWFDGTQRGMVSLRQDVENKSWFDDLYLYVPMNKNGLDAPKLYVGIIPEEDTSGVETYDILDNIKENEYPGLSYAGYYTDNLPSEVPLDLALVVTPSHVSNNEL